MKRGTSTKAELYEAIKDASRARSFLVSRPHFNSAKESLDILEPVLKNALDALFDKIEIKLQSLDSEVDSGISDDDVREMLVFIIQDCELENEAAEFYSEIRGSRIVSELESMCVTMFGDSVVKSMQRTYSTSDAGSTSSKESRFKWGRRTKGSVRKNHHERSHSNSSTPMIHLEPHTLLTDRRYEKGQHGLYRLLSRAEGLWVREFKIAVRLLPMGPAGKRVFESAFSRSAKVFKAIVLDQVLPSTKTTYKGTACIFVLVDVCECFQQHKESLFRIFGSESSFFASQQINEETPLKNKNQMVRAKSVRVMGGSSQRQLTGPWNDIQYVFDTWHKETMMMMRGLSSSPLLARIELLSETATVHPSSTNFIKFLSKTMAYEDFMGKLCLEMHAGDHREDSRTAIALFVENLITRYVDMLVQLDPSERFTGQKGIFILNNLHFIISGIITDHRLSEMLQDSISWTKQQKRFQIIKTVCIKSIVQPIIEILLKGPGFQTSPPPGTLTSTQKKMTKEFAAAITNWLKEHQALYSRLEIPNFDLRVEFRRKIRSNILEYYNTMYDLMGNVVFIKYREKYLPYSPEMVSVMVSQYFELSETTSNPQALISR